MDLSKRIDRVEQKLPPQPPAPDANSFNVKMLTMAEVSSVADQYRAAPDRPIPVEEVAELKRRAELRLRYFGFSLWYEIGRHISVSPWSIASEWKAIKRRLEWSWRRKGEAIGQPLELDTSGATVVAATLAAELMHPGLWALPTPAPVTSWVSVLYHGVPNEISPELATIKLNGASMKLEAIGLTPDSYPWNVREEWEARTGRTSEWWRAELEPFPAA